MTNNEREQWDERYASGSYSPRDEASPFLREWLPRIPAGPALDVATGTGRHAFLLAESGFDVQAVDISAIAIERAREEAGRRGLAIDWRTADLDDAELPREAYALVTVLRYRNPELWPRLRTALRPDGWILIEHHMTTRIEVGGPPTDSFRLEPGELLEAFSGARILHYSEQLEPADLGSAEQFAIARLVACVGDPGW